jgi:asparagine synthase (glutamine-hydrolysing)
MANEDETIWLVFDGEIYNFLEIRPQLEARGHRFLSETCAEVVLHAYEEDGLNCLKKIKGMFAFALWDGVRQRLWLVRDRMGIKPMFYAMVDQTLLFGSEIKAILSHPSMQAKVDFEAFNLFLSTSYTPAPKTLFEGIHQLLPGQYLTISPEYPEPDLETYWDIPYPLPRFQGSFERAVERLTEFLERAVQTNLESDVPLGSLLSGSLDSNATTLWMTRVNGHVVPTYSVAFQGQQRSKLPQARRASRWLNTRHTERILTPQLAIELPKIVWHAEEPIINCDTLPIYYISQLARQDVKAVLSGTGGDELFAGYPLYGSSLLARRLQMLPRSLFSHFLLPIIEHLPIDRKKVGQTSRLCRFLRGAGLHWHAAHNIWRQVFTEENKDQIFTPDLRQSWDRQAMNHVCDPYFTRRAGCHPLDQLLYVDTRLHLPGKLLVKIDRMSMAHGLEIRTPLLDEDLVNFAVSLPPEFKWHRKNGKLILRQAMTQHLPNSLINHRSQGTDVPMNAWLSGVLHNFTRDTLSPRNVRATGFLHPEGVQQLMNAHQNGNPLCSQQLWGVLGLMLWWKQFISRS